MSDRRRFIVYTSKTGRPIVDAPAGCPACQENRQVLPGHHLCEIIPPGLNSVEPFLDNGGWRLEWTGGSLPQDNAGNHVIDLPAL